MGRDVQDKKNVIVSHTKKLATSLACHFVVVVVLAFFCRKKKKKKIHRKEEVLIERLQSK